MLMERHSLTDRQAFERIRAEARHARRPLIDVVDDLLRTEPS
jgi:AmiR/NasT family two-component response regulator